jgi:peroxiredoxin
MISRLISAMLGIMVCLSILLSTVFTGCSSKSEKPEEKIQVPPPSIPRSAGPQFDWKDIDGNVISNTQLEGRWVIIHVWTTWSPACAREVPELVELQKRFGTKTLQILGLSLDEKAEEDVRPYIERYQIPYPIICMSMDRLAQYMGEIDAIPSTFIINPKWELVNRHTGYIGGKVLEAELLALSNEKPSAEKK